MVSIAPFDKFECDDWWLLRHLPGRSIQVVDFSDDLYGLGAGVTGPSFGAFVPKQMNVIFGRNVTATALSSDALPLSLSLGAFGSKQWFSSSVPAPMIRCSLAERSRRSPAMPFRTCDAHAAWARPRRSARALTPPPLTKL